VEKGMSDLLTPKQAAFVKEYQIDRNGKRAAVRAGYSEKTAQEQSSRLLSKVKVKNVIKADQAKHAERCAVTIESLAQELSADRDMARRLEQPSPAITATMSIAKLYGLEVNKNQTETSGEMVVIIKRFTDGPAE
jgi:phage terminase small subunit